MDFQEFFAEVSSSFQSSWSGTPWFWVGFLIMLAALTLILVVANRKAIMEKMRKVPGAAGGDSSKVLDGDEPILERLLNSGAELSIYLDQEEEAPVGRFRMTDQARGLLNCEMTGGEKNWNIVPGEKLAVFFKPMSMGKEKLNTMYTRLHALRAGNGLILERPDSFAMTHRRQFVRKKILSQEYVRLRIWLDDTAQDVKYYDERPGTWAVNSYDARIETQLESTVVNISKGGLAVSVREELTGLVTPGNRVVLNLNIYSTKMRLFRSTWLAGVIRSIAPGEKGFNRLGIQFTHKFITTPEKYWAPLSGE